MTDFGTVLGEVFSGLFGPWMMYILAVVVVVVAFFGALIVSDPESPTAWQLIAAAWITWVILAIVAVAFMIYLGQFDAWSWTVKPELVR